MHVGNAFDYCTSCDVWHVGGCLGVTGATQCLLWQVGATCLLNPLYVPYTVSTVYGLNRFSDTVH